MNMQILNLDYVILFLLSSIIMAIALGWFSIKIAPNLGLMDIPGSADHKIHNYSVPLTGGLVIIDTLIVMILLTGLWKFPEFWAILISSVTIGIFGLLDDFIHLTPFKKIIGQIIGSIILIYLGVQINIFNSPEFFYRTESTFDMWLNFIFTILWLITLTNAFNFIDSIDGLALGLSAFSITSFLVVSLSTGQVTLVYFCSILLGICIGLYFFNAYPAKLFLGDSGAQILGFLLATLAIIFQPKTGFQSSTWFVPILLFYVPLFDLILVVISRVRRKKQIYQASRDHTYHRLAERGFSKHHAVLFMHGTSLIMSMIGYLCLNLPVFYANIVFFLSLLLGISLIIELDKNYS